MRTVDRFFRIIATVFYLGYVPFAPGTAGSLAAVLWYFLMRKYWIGYASSIIILFALGCLALRGIKKIFKRKDPKEVVIDEFIGMSLVLFFVSDSIASVIAGFLLFRFFDIVKIQPIKKIDSMKSPFFVMLDDLVAGVYAVIVLNIVRLCF